MRFGIAPVDVAGELSYFTLIKDNSLAGGIDDSVGVVEVLGRQFDGSDLSWNNTLINIR